MLLCFIVMRNAKYYVQMCKKLQLLADQTPYRSFSPGPLGTSDPPASLAAWSGNESICFSLQLCLSNDVCSTPNSWRTRNQRHAYSWLDDTEQNFGRDLPLGLLFTRRPASADRTARRQFQAVFPVITGSFPTNVIAHLHGLSMDLTVGRTVGPTVDSTVGWTVGLTIKLCKHWLDSRSNYWSNYGNHWPTSEPNAG